MRRSSPLILAAISRSCIQRMTRVGVENRRNDFFFGVGIIIRQCHRLFSDGRSSGSIPGGQRFRRRAAASKIFIQLRPLDERRNELIQLAVHRAAELLALHSTRASKTC